MRDRGGSRDGRLGRAEVKGCGFLCEMRYGFIIGWVNLPFTVFFKPNY